MLPVPIALISITVERVEPGAKVFDKICFLTLGRPLFFFFPQDTWNCRYLYRETMRVMGGAVK